MKRKQKNNVVWFLVGVLGIILAAPNATVIRYAVSDIDPTLFNVMRFGILAVILTPYIVIKRGLLNRRSLRYSLLMGVFMTIAVISYVWAIKLSQASFVAVLTLVTPIVFIFYSVRLNKEKLSKQSFAGISLAASGALVVVVLPLVLQQGSNFAFYPVAAALALTNSLSFPLAIIFAKKAHESGAPIMVTMGLSSWIVFLTSCLTVPLSYTGVLPAVSGGVLFGALYSALAVALLSRIMNIFSYERLGSVVTSGLAYTETLLAILIPIFVLQEKLSAEMIVGGALILLGVYVIQRRKTVRTKRTSSRKRR